MIYFFFKTNTQRRQPSAIDFECKHINVNNRSEVIKKVIIIVRIGDEMVNIKVVNSWDIQNVMVVAMVEKRELKGKTKKKEQYDWWQFRILLLKKSKSS